MFLFPGSLLPLHVFERRYRQMVEDLLDRPGWMVIGPIVAGREAEAAGAPPVYPIAGLGEVVKHQRLGDGRFLITLAGLARVRIRELESERLYRKVEFEPLEEVQPDAGEVDGVCDRLRRAILSRSDTFLNLPADLPPSPLADLLLQTLELPVDRMQAAYEETSVARRAALALKEHEARG